jgi:redox-regulated HSP33 family molecular chaperone
MDELSLDFTVDVGGDGLVRRIVVVWDMEGAMRATADLFPGLSEDELREGGAAVSQTQELTFRDLGEPVTIEVPDEADVVEAGGLLGG